MSTLHFLSFPKAAAFFLLFQKDGWDGIGIRHFPPCFDVEKRRPCICPIFTTSVRVQVNNHSDNNVQQPLAKSDLSYTRSRWHKVTMMSTSADGQMEYDNNRGEGDEHDEHNFNKEEKEEQPAAAAASEASSPSHPPSHRAPAATADATPDITLLFYNPTRKSNWGPVVRCAVAFGISRVHVIGQHRYNDKGSHGSSKHIQLIAHPTIDDAMTSLSQPRNSDRNNGNNYDGEGGYAIIGLLPYKPSSLPKDCENEDGSLPVHAAAHNDDDERQEVQNQEEEEAQKTGLSTAGTIEQPSPQSWVCVQTSQPQTPSSHYTTLEQQQQQQLPRSFPAHTRPFLDRGASGGHGSGGGARVCFVIDKSLRGLPLELAKQCSSFIHVPHMGVAIVEAGDYDDDDDGDGDDDMKDDNRGNNGSGVCMNGILRTDTTTPTAAAAAAASPGSITHTMKNASSSSSSASLIGLEACLSIVLYEYHMWWTTTNTTVGAQTANARSTGSATDLSPEVDGGGTSNNSNNEIGSRNGNIRTYTGQKYQVSKVRKGACTALERAQIQEQRRKQRQLQRFEEEEDEENDTEGGKG